MVKTSKKTGFTIGEIVQWKRSKTKNRSEFNFSDTTMPVRILNKPMGGIYKVIGKDYSYVQTVDESTLSPLPPKKAEKLRREHFAGRKLEGGCGEDLTSIEEKLRAIDDPTFKPTPVSYLDRDAIMKMFPVGAEVVRGPTWCWGEQDHHKGEPSVGKVVKYDDHDSSGQRSTWVRVQWKSGDSNVYRVGGKDNAQDVQLVQTSTSTPAPVLEVLAEVDDPANYERIPRGRGRRPKDYDYRTEYPEGTKVVRGPTWSWDKQDHKDGKPSVGVLTENHTSDSLQGPGWLRVKWASDHEDSYRVNRSLGFEDVTPVQLKSSTKPKTIKAIKISTEPKRWKGVRVVRGPGWDWDEQDMHKGKQMVGVVEDEPDRGNWVSVKWPNGDSYNYRLEEKDIIPYTGEGDYVVKVTSEKKPSLAVGSLVLVLPPKKGETHYNHYIKVGTMARVKSVWADVAEIEGLNKEGTFISQTVSIWELKPLEE